jgi:two-component system nitrate/nitrite response regulator NarL
MMEAGLPTGQQLHSAAEMLGNLADRGPLKRFSGRELNVLRHLQEGDPNKVIARGLGISEATVKVHIKSILRKAQLRNRTQVALWATKQELLAGQADLEREDPVLGSGEGSGAPAAQKLPSAPQC